MTLLVVFVAGAVFMLLLGIGIGSCIESPDDDELLAERGVVDWETWESQFDRDTA